MAMIGQLVFFVNDFDGKYIDHFLQLSVLYSFR